MLVRVLLAIILVTLGCSSVDGKYSYSVKIVVRDEVDGPIAGAVIEVEGRVLHTDSQGEATLEGLYGPAVTLVRASGYLAEPITIDRSDGEVDGRVEVRLFARYGADGARRWTMHVGGDAMLGRRYLAPEKGLPMLPAHDLAGGARAVVSDLAPAFSLADMTTLNLECVVGEHPDSAIYPAKRFILQSPPASLAALEDLSVDLVTLGNNHVRDYLEAGIDTTVEALDSVSMPYAGVSNGAEVDVNPAYVEVYPGFEVATLSYTTVDGDFVNDSYPGADAAALPGCGEPGAPDECFMFDVRSWGCPARGVPVQARRIGPAWQAFAELEAQIEAADLEDELQDELIACWDSLYAVYPEMQDWTARRGHGGASGWHNDASPLAISEAAARSDLVVVQLHAGFQFQTAPSENVQRLAQRSIESGADIVIAHHPHVLQGAQWYQGKLILYSLGNLIFDQDFLVTFASAFVRTVWEGSTLLEARLIPLELVGYRPIVTAGAVAERTALGLWESSATPAYTAREIGTTHVLRYLGGEPEPGTELAHIYSRHHDAVITKQAPAVEALEFSFEPGETVTALDFAGLIEARAGGASIELGRELFGWGHLEDSLADRVAQPAAQWFLPGEGRYDPVLRLDDDAATGYGWFELYRNASFSGDSFVRPIARIPVPEHRFYTKVEGAPSPPNDGVARYTARLAGRLSGAGQPYLRLEFFAFDDTDPTSDPVTIAIGPALDLDFELDADDRWHTTSVDIEPELLWDGELRANVVLVRIRFRSPTEGESVFAFDDFEFIEWRAAEQMPPHFGAYTHLRRSAAGPSSVTLEGMAMGAP